MSFTRRFVSATFTSGLIALSLQVSGVVQASPIADTPSSSSQNGQEKVPSGMRDPESSSKMQRDKDGAGITDTQSHRIGGTSAQRSDTDTPKTPGSRLTERTGMTGSGSEKTGATGTEETADNSCESRGAQNVLSAEQEHGNTGYSIRGEVLRVEGNTAVVRRQDGEVVSLQTDQTNLTQGDFVQANLSGQNEVLWIGPLRSTDRRNEHEPDCR